MVHTFSLNIFCHPMFIFETQHRTILWLSSFRFFKRTVLDLLASNSTDAILDFFLSTRKLQQRFKSACQELQTSARENALKYVFGNFWVPYICAKEINL